MADEVEAVVIGAGVIGLAVARQLAMAGIDVVVLESANAIGTEITSRNSEVIHAGTYYAKDFAEGRVLRRGAREALPLLHGPRRALPQKRQADRRCRDLGNRYARGPGGTRRGERGA